MKNDFTGATFGRLTVISELPSVRASNGNIYRRFRCRCSCGNTKDTAYRNLASGGVKSCGCLLVENAKKMALRRYGKRRHGRLTTYFDFADEGF